MAVNHACDAGDAAEAAAIGRAGGEASALQADVGRMPGVESMFEAADAELARRGRERGTADDDA